MLWNSISCDRRGPSCDSDVRDHVSKVVCVTGAVLLARVWNACIFPWHA